MDDTGKYMFDGCVPAGVGYVYELPKIGNL